MAKGNSSVITKTDKNKPPVKPTGKGKFKLTKKQIAIIGGVVAALVVLVLILVLILGRKQTQPETDNAPDVAETTQTVDYNQKITSEDGGEFKAEYQAGSEKSFAMRFSDLKCEDDCRNVSEVKLGGKVLKQGEDYEVKSGSIIIILTDNFMKSLRADKYDLVIAVVDDDKTSFYGVKFTVKPEPTCKEGEILEKGECVKKPEEKPSQNNQQSNTTTTKPSAQPSKPAQQPSKPTQPSKSQAQIECERRAGPTAFTIIVWLNESQKQAWMEIGYAADIVALTESGTFEQDTKMVWRDNRCQPSIKGSGAVGGIRQPYNLQGLDPKIQANKGKNLVIWFWENGSEEYEFVNDPDSFIYNHF